MICLKCKGPVTMQVQVTLKLPGKYENKITKEIIRKKETELIAADWPSASYMCNDRKCSFNQYPTSGLSKDLEKSFKIVNQLNDLIEAYELESSLTDKDMTSKLFKIAYEARRVFKECTK
jgi:ABC-type Zn uptake system ZnuABC Zn-binding protein ZnuA